MHAHSHTLDPVPQSKNNRPLVITFFIILGYAVVEGLVGWMSGSLALLGDAGHMVTDSTALGIALIGTWIAMRPPTHQFSFGSGRAETLAALFNGLFMIGIVISIVVMAVTRLQSPVEVNGIAVMWVAGLGLIINIVSLLVLSSGDQTLNTKGALLHIVGDLLGSIAALVSGAVIYFTQWTPIDPILSLFICALIIYSSLRLLKEVLHVFMEGVPGHINLPDVGLDMAAQPDVVQVHDLHIWTLSSGIIALSAHIVLRDMYLWKAVMHNQTKMLESKYKISHVTLQPEEVGTQILKPMSIIKANATNE